MKKPTRRAPLSPSGLSPSRANPCDASHGPWEFTSSARLFAVGAIDGVRRAAYRTAAGEMRFLPL
ncbi:MAG: hypothetical protein WDO13_18525 [Verrucomicrobiota bacterium]